MRCFSCASSSPMRLACQAIRDSTAVVAILAQKACPSFGWAEAAAEEAAGFVSGLLGTAGEGGMLMMGGMPGFASAVPFSGSPACVCAGFAASAAGGGPGLVVTAGAGTA